MGIAMVALIKNKGLASWRCLGLLLKLDLHVGLELRLWVRLLRLGSGGALARLAYIQLNILSRLWVKESLCFHLNWHVHHEILTRAEVLQHLTLGQWVGLGIACLYMVLCHWSWVVGMMESGRRGNMSNCFRCSSVGSRASSISRGNREGNRSSSMR